MPDLNNRPTELNSLMVLIISNKVICTAVGSNVCLRQLTAVRQNGKCRIVLPQYKGRVTTLDH
jgi:hypothetical protein